MARLASRRSWLSLREALATTARLAYPDRAADIAARDVQRLFLAALDTNAVTVLLHNLRDPGSPKRLLIESYITHSFGCGPSRTHSPWAKCLMSPSAVTLTGMSLHLRWSLQSALACPSHPPRPLNNAVIKALWPVAVIVVRGVPEEIVERRAKDTSRMRPERSAEELRRHQDRALALAEQYAVDTRTPLRVVASGDHGALARALEELLP